MLSRRHPEHNKRYTETESEGMEKTFHATGNKEIKGLGNNAYIIQNRLQNKGYTITRNKESYYTIIKG